MSRINGLNDSKTLKSKQPQAAIKIWKGNKKTDRSAGSNLNNLFRIEAPVGLRSVLKRAYDAQEKDGSLFVDHINLTPAYLDEFKAFDSKMAAYNASRPIHFCDRNTIHTEYIESKDPFGGIYFQPIESNKPCPVKGTNFDCPLKCTRTGDFYFYIWELLDYGSPEFARLQVHGVEDNQSIASVLDDVKSTIGCIRTSPFVNENTKSNIIYELTRRKVQTKYPVKEGGVRTAKRGTRDDWVVNLALHPEWLKKYQSYQQTEQLKALNYQPSMRLIEQVHGAGLIDGFVEVETKQLPGIEQKDSFRDFKAELAIAYRNNGWDKDSWNAMMIEKFGTTELSADMDFDLILAIASSGIEKDRIDDF